MRMKTGTRTEWLEQRRELLKAEKAHRRAADELAKRRRSLPWVQVETDYRFTGPNGEVSLAEIFANRSQLVVYHFMYGADWEKPCPSCSFWADHFDGARQHLEHRDVRLVAVSQAPHEVLQRWAEKARWRFPWYSSAGCDFNRDFHVTLDADDEGRSYNFKPSTAKGEMPGVSTFIKTTDGILSHLLGLRPRARATELNLRHFGPRSERPR